jgi:hypothetical protein
MLLPFLLLSSAQVGRPRIAESLVVFLLPGLGDFYQEQRAQESCEACPANNQRYVGVLSAANRSSCQCKKGVTLLSMHAKLKLTRLPFPRCAGYFNRDGQAGEVREPRLAASHCSPAA